MQLPQDDFILLSYLNMKLRDGGLTLGALCEELEISREEVETRLRAIGYIYHEEQNRFL